VLREIYTVMRNAAERAKPPVEVALAA
jgi:hypothetical protein